MIKLNNLLVVLLVTFCHLVGGTDPEYPYDSSFTPKHLRYLQNETRELFTHAWSSYMSYGFPNDEVRPITCQPYGPDFKNIDNIVRNDAMGNVSLSLLDNIDTLIIMEKWDDLEIALNYLKNEQYTLFEKDTIVQVFEFTIRSLGGLLSSHLLLTDITNNNMLPKKYARFKKICDDYDGFLLEMAYNLGLKLIPAFKTSTNIPSPRIHLTKGLEKVPPRLQKENCLSGATTPVLEFTLLSKLTGDPQFEYYTQLTFWKLWSLRLPLNLLPMTIDPASNTWMDSITGVGASVDSFYEYAVKSSILFDDEYMWTVFKASYEALLIHLAQGGGPLDGSMIFANIDTYSGTVSSTWIDALGGFFPGLQVLAGQLNDSIKTHLIYLRLWDHFDLIPERWNHISNWRKLSRNPPTNKKKVYNSIPLEWYPLRPEFIESTYYLYRATKDPMYLQIGTRVLELLKTRYKSKCGLNGFQDIRTGQLQDRMETFVMSETLKYLYLLFDHSNEVFLHNEKLMKGKSWIFSTEAHPLWFDKNVQSRNVKLLKDRNVTSSNSLNESDQAEKLILNSFLSKFRHSTSSKLIESADSHLFYRNVTLAPVQREALPGIEKMEYLDVKPGFDDRFYVCQRNTPFNKPTREFMSSGYYTWGRLFEADKVFEDSFVRPYHLNKDGLTNSYIELLPSFLSKYTMFENGQDDLHLKCARVSTTSEHDLFIGDRNEITTVEVSKIKYNSNISNIPDDKDLPILENDLWVPFLDSLRLRIETLKPGLIDSFNEEITEDYIQSLRLDDFDAANGICNKKEAKNALGNLSLAFRIKKLNGIFVDSGLVIWTSPFEVLDFIKDSKQSGQPPVLNIGSDSRVHLQGTVIENLMVWSGPNL